MTTLTLDLLLTDEERRAQLESDVIAGLKAVPKQLPPKYFYDDRGSELFEEITRLPEYYPTRAERDLLAAHADAIAVAAGAGTLLELGSGASEKTRLLLDGMARAGDLDRYVPVDVSEGALRDAVQRLRADYPELPVHGVVADFVHHLDTLPAEGTRLLAFLGGTLGNFPPDEERAAFLADLAAVMRPGESLLLGVDLVKDPGRLIAAYDDAAGVTAEFNRNVLHVLNRELDADFEPDAFDHVAHWDAENEWIEMRLRAREAMHVRLPAIDLEIEFDRGEHLRTEISAKFRRPPLEAELATAGLRAEQWWSDGDYGLVLARR